LTSILKDLNYEGKRPTAAAYVLVLLLVQTGLHVKYLDLPPAGFHQWRQTLTLSVARNFDEEEMNIFQPRVDSRGEHSGITGMEFPILNYSLAIAYRILGNSFFVQRCTILSYSYLAILGCFLFTKTLFRSEFTAFVSTL
jgi:hypothetical protein